uniref:mitogen-activated protein kinase kinase n=1 Tax=Syphacia muris TaxID=451379 RepID=A0A0N5B0U7_9BILA
MDPQDLRQRILPLRPRLPEIDLISTKNDMTSPELCVICSQFGGKLSFSPNENYTFTTADLEDNGEIGAGNFGRVNRMRHKVSGHLMAVKIIRANTLNDLDQKLIRRELEAIIESKCENIVQFYGAIFTEGCCWICMELMDLSLEKLYCSVFAVDMQLPEEILGYITVSTVNSLSYLKEALKIIHRDVKPSNILLNCKGCIKLCDFGISGRLIDSIVKTRDVGCRPYMAPERLQSSDPYDVRSDVWSLGITLFEVATGKFPYSTWENPFEQLQEVVNGNPPVMKADRYSPQFVTFVNSCLIKERKERPKYKDLMQLDFYKTYNVTGVDLEFAHTVVGDYLSKILSLHLDVNNLDSQTRNINFSRFD